MSGIAGIIRLDGAPVAPGDIEAMLATMARRGPDRRRGWCEGNAAFGQALLATTPEAVAEIQPWVHPDSGCVVVSDSRLDNRPELLHALEIRHATPDEIGDGELLHAAWQRWGERCAEQLLGDFAFAIWDPRNQKLFCARDVMGVRPFYYHYAPGRLFAFASETDALLTLRDVPTAIDEGRIADALVSELEGIDKTSTFYQAIVRLPPAQTLRLENGRLRLREYWHPLMHRLVGASRLRSGMDRSATRPTAAGRASPPAQLAARWLDVERWARLFFSRRIGQRPPARGGSWTAANLLRDQFAGGVSGNPRRTLDASSSRNRRDDHRHAIVGPADPGLAHEPRSSW